MSSNYCYFFEFRDMSKLAPLVFVYVPGEERGCLETSTLDGVEGDSLDIDLAFMGEVVKGVDSLVDVP